ncbi:MAG: hypothetical protein HY821_09945 [Acidobacteria bacterium]|nr:hypothetical protein [Acidobacteriota bacterium]
MPNGFEQLLGSTSLWIYVAVFGTAVLEGFVLTTFAINGTIGFVALGGLLAKGYLNPPAVVASIYFGTMVGDGLTFILSTRLQRIRAIARHQRRIEKYRMPLVQRPFRFLVLCHLTPYLKGVSALLAGGVLPWRTWIRAEAVGAFCGTLLFTGLGALGTTVVLNARHQNAASASSGFAVLVAVVVIWMRALRPCRIAGICETRSDPRLRGRNWKRLFFVVYYPFWKPIRMVEAALRLLPTRSCRPDLAQSFPDAMPGDIFLVRLHAPAPWGKWAHTAIAIDRDRFCHGFGKVITEHQFDGFPVRYTIAHLRVKCTPEEAARAASAAAQMIGRPVSILARPGDTSKFSCTSLACYAYSSVGITLGPENTGRVVPDDLFRSPQVELIRLVFTEGRMERKGADHAEQQLV